MSPNVAVAERSTSSALAPQGQLVLPPDTQGHMLPSSTSHSFCLLDKAPPGAMRGTQG